MSEDQLDLSIVGLSGPGHATAVARYSHDFAIETLPCDALAELQNFHNTLASAAIGKKKTPTAGELTNFGRSLFEFTVRGSIKTLFDRLPNSHIRLQIYSNRTDLQALPWEYMQMPNTSPGPNSLRSVVRIVPTIGVRFVARAALQIQSLRVLFVYADPVDQDSVEWVDIYDTLKREFGVFMPKGTRLDIVPAATRQALFDALEAESYDILHFAGHGDVGSDGSGRILLRDFKTRTTDPVTASELGTLLRNKELSLVVLSACNTSAGDFSKDFAIVSRTLVQCGVPAVVANQFPVTNSVVAKFAGAFYTKLLRTGDVDLAVASGRGKLAFEPQVGSAARIEWGIPTLYRHVACACLFSL